ncbi:zinc finger CCCH domain-containing protein 17-like [Magnolia sinica]|uniref:zinc finger CCCH domain-containing protein 17-like n=1 Tax=Magnolia sinica TaxID=86752 RepID=UPI0026582307|nr:zinc finger CCCH domain-containing protein 17-like [Magnolia sinica]
MDMDSAERNGNKRIIFNRLGPAPANHRSPKVCFHWQAGRCNRHPCHFLHADLPPKRTHQYPDDRNAQASGSPAFSGHNGSSNWGRGRGRGGRSAGGRGGVPSKIADKLCSHWAAGNCSYGETCRFVHSWFVGESFTFLTLLEGHQKAVSGIAFPSGSDKLYSGSNDESVRVWDCQTGQCAGVVNLGGEVGCMISEGPWVFVGIPNAVKVWNTQTSAELSLSGPVGQVYALVLSSEILFAGTQDGSILVWKFSAERNSFEPAASLNGHSLAVVSLVVGAMKLYSGSMDHTIKVWDLGTLQCIQTLTDHTSVIMSLLCWDQFLLSCSLDKTIKVWVATETGNLEVTYTHNEEHGVLSLFGMHDAQARPVLLSSCNDNTVRFYDLPSFSERGKLFSKGEVRAIQIGPGGVFFTGDGTGDLRVWKWLTAEQTSA